MISRRSSQRTFLSCLQGELLSPCLGSPVLDCRRQSESLQITSPRCCPTMCTCVQEAARKISVHLAAAHRPASRNERNTVRLWLVSNEGLARALHSKAMLFEPAGKRFTCHPTQNQQFPSIVTTCWCSMPMMCCWKLCCPVTQRFSVLLHLVMRFPPRAIFPFQSF